LTNYQFFAHQKAWLHHQAAPIRPDFPSLFFQKPIFLIAAAMIYPPIANLDQKFSLDAVIRSFSAFDFIDLLYNQDHFSSFN